MHRRFLQHGKLYADLSLLDPLHFPDINLNGLPHNALEDISKCLIPFDEDATIENLQPELCSLALHWDTMKNSPLSEYTTRESQSLTSEEEEDNQEQKMHSLQELCCVLLRPPPAAEVFFTCVPQNTVGLQFFVDLVLHTSGM